MEEAIGHALSAGIGFSVVSRDGTSPYTIIDYVPNKTIVRLIEHFPEYLFDKKLFDVSYMEIELDDTSMQERLRESAKERIVSYLKDLLYLSSTPGYSISKNDLSRVALSLDSLTAKMVDHELYY